MRVRKSRGTKKVRKAPTTPGGNFSPLEETLSFQLTAIGFVEGRDFVREHKFHPVRKWRMDFAFLELKIGVEVMGGGRNGAHLRYVSYKGDCEKMCAAAGLGWVVLHVVGEHVKSGQALSWIKAAVEARQSG